MKQFRLFTLGAVVLLSGTMVLAGVVLAQPETQYPPNVIDVLPYPGEEVAPNAPVTITFDMDMDAASVEAAWTMDPAAPGTFTWADARTVSFVPDDGWQRATRYSVTIGTEAKAANGLALEAPYEFFVQTVGYLQVSAVVPAADATGVAADATITVSFNRPVVPLLSTEELDQLPQPLVSDPPIEGTGEWINTSIYQFTPSKPLSGGTTYTVSIPSGLTDVTGSALDESYTWRFKTLSPEILSVNPYQGQSGVRLEEPITVEFSQPMNRASTEEAFMLVYNGERVPGTFEWLNEDRVLAFKPTERLNIESVYMIQIAPSAQSASGQATLEQGINYSFSTIPYPGISQTYPSNGESFVSPGSSVTIYFKSPMNTETFEGKAVIEQPEGVEWEPVVYDSSSLSMNFATQPDTAYVITFKRGAEDVYGNPIETDYTFSFTTGSIESRAWLPSSRSFVITNAYRENTRIALGVSGKPEVGFKLYRIPTEKIGQVIANYYYYEDIKQVASRDNLYRDWTEELQAETAYGTDEVLLYSEQGGKLPTGVYLLSADLPDYNEPEWMGLGVVNTNLTVKRSPDEALIWVTDIQSAEPVANAKVSLYWTDGTPISSGQTDNDGLYRAQVSYSGPDGNAMFYAIAENEDHYGVWMSWSTSEPSTVSGYIYTDRPIYRPGQTVYFRGVIRDRDDMIYTLPAAEKVHVTIDLNYGSQIVFDQDMPLTEFGTFNGQVDLADDAAIGNATINVSYKTGYDASGYFTVAEFRVPEYKVTVTPDSDSIIQGDPLKAAAAASYYFGGAVSNANMNWTIHGEEAYFNYSGPGSYSFYDDTQPYMGWVDMGSGTLTTDANGTIIMEAANTKAPAIRPMLITMEGEAYDESGQYIAGSATVMAHPASVYVGMKTDRYFGTEGNPINVDLIAVTPESAPIAGQNIDVKVIQVRWERIPIEGQFGQYDWQVTETEIESTRITTGQDGTAKYTFTPAEGGIYRIRAVVRDERERENSSSQRLWVTGRIPIWWGRPTDQIDLITDKDSYVTGDTAEILVPIPFSGISYVLITTERVGIQTAEVMRVEGSTLVYKLPITEQHVPTIYVSATLMKGMDEENLNPAYKMGTVALNVTPVNQRIDVVLTPSATLAQPGQTVSFDVETRDSRGEPVSAEVGLTLTDQAILSLMPPNSVSLEEQFYGMQSNYVYTNVALQQLIDVQTDQALKQRDADNALGMAEEGAMAPAPTATAAQEMFAADAAAPGTGGGAPPVTVREDFQQTPLWAPGVVTDTTGKATVSVTLPDNLTTWHLDARGLTAETQVGDAALDVMSTLPLLTRPVTPRFMVVGDKVTLASVINNNTEQPQQVQATLEATGVTLESDATQTVTIDPAGRARVEWLVRVEDVPYVDLTFYAIGENGAQDATKPTLATGPNGTIPVYRYTAPDTVGTGGILRTEGGRTEAISLPPRLDTDQGELVVHLDPSLAVTTVDSLDYLKNYPHQCIEQTISRFLPNAVTYRALKQLGIDDPVLADNLRVVLEQALQKLAAEQRYDGGWGWFINMESNPYLTAYAALGLIEARDAGFTIDPEMLNRALNYVRQFVIRPTIDTPDWELNRQAFYFYVFARAGQVSESELNTLLDYRLEMDYWSLSFLLMAYHEAVPDSPAVAQLISDLQTGAIMSATGAHWEEDQVDWWNWNTDTRTTALALGALARTVPTYDVLPNVVRWLMVARQGDHWETTQETVWAVMALTDWMVTTGELQGNYTYNTVLNHEPVGEGTVTPDTVREGQVLRIQVRDLLADEVNRLTVSRSEGDGVLYYTAHLKLRLWAAEAKPISRGVTVSREYFVEGDPTTPATQAKMGDAITVRVTITLPQDIYYFVLEDPIPAGTEPIDTSLLTTSQNNEPPSIAPTYDPWWYWGWWYWDHTEMRDEQVNLYADWLPNGTYVYTYQVRATIPGEFQTMPSHGYAFYFPEVFGRSAGTLFTITPNTAE